MLHQTLLWPEQFDMRLWYFALEHVAYLWNNIPDASYDVNHVIPAVGGMAPIELFTGVTKYVEMLRSEHIWGCPAYVLDPILQDGKTVLKWDFRTRQGQYLGQSPKRSSSI